MKAEIDAESLNSLAEQIQTAKQGNKDTLNNIKENAQNVEKVLEMKKDINKTNAYIKTLEMARAEELKNKTAQRYYIPKKSNFWRNWVIFMLVCWAILIICDTKYIAGGFWAILAAAIVFAPIYLFQVICNWIASNPKYMWSRYKDCRKMVEIVKACGNRIPAFYGGKKSYYDALSYIKEFDANYPQVAALYVSELSPEELEWFARNSL